MKTYEIVPLCFDGYELVMCEEVEATFFGVYSRDENGYAESLEDYRTKKEANDYLQSLTHPTTL